VAAEDDGRRRRFIARRPRGVLRNATAAEWRGSLKSSSVGGNTIGSMHPDAERGAGELVYGLMAGGSFAMARWRNDYAAETRLRY
jgi:hypothetical protein